MTDYVVHFEPMGRKGRCKSTEYILDCARRYQIGIATVCGGAGTCGKCRVKISSGSVSEMTGCEAKVFSPKQIREGWRLACQVRPLSDIRLEVASESMSTHQRLQVEGKEAHIEVDPAVKTYLVTRREGLLVDLSNQYHLCCSRVHPDVLKSLQAEAGSTAHVVIRGEEVVAIWPNRTPLLGLAVDVGTTKIAAYLVDLEDGHTLASKGVMNPQVSYGEDVISRIAAAAAPAVASAMHFIVIEAINRLAADLCADVGRDTDEIVDAVAVGNTAIHHFLVGLPVKSLIVPPFAPAATQCMDIKARSLGLKFASGAYLHVLPNVAGFVGADHIAMLLASGALETEGPSLFVDVGTNTEVSLVYDGRITAVSCASGPALEGAHIKDGMRAARGAIERVVIGSDTVQVQVIDDAPPTGICGSGILDTLAQMYLAGVIDQGGRILEAYPGVRNRGRIREFVLVRGEGGHPDITFTQADVRQTQLGKAGIRAGIQTLLDYQDCLDQEVREVIIAGTFGSYIDIASAVEIGMLPPLPMNRFHQVGNAAGMGAKLALVSLHERARARQLGEKIAYLELSTMSGFSKTFTEALALGQFHINHGKKEAVKCN